MIIEMRSKSQITVPHEVVTKLNLNEGDRFEIIVKGGVIFLIPVAVYPKSYVAALEEAATETAEAYKHGKIPVFDTPEDLLTFLHSEAYE